MEGSWLSPGLLVISANAVSHLSPGIKYPSIQQLAVQQLSTVEATVPRRIASCHSVTAQQLLWRAPPNRAYRQRPTGPRLGGRGEHSTTTACSVLLVYSGEYTAVLLHAVVVQPVSVFKRGLQSRPHLNTTTGFASPMQTRSARHRSDSQHGREATPHHPSRGSRLIVHTYIIKELRHLPAGGPRPTFVVWGRKWPISAILGP